MDGVPDRGRSTSPSSRAPNHSPRLGPSRLSSSRIRSSQPSSSSCLWLWFRRKQTKVLLALIALFALFFFVNYIMLLRLQHQQDRPQRNRKSTLRSSLSLSLQVSLHLDCMFFNPHYAFNNLYMYLILYYYV